MNSRVTASAVDPEFCGNLRLSGASNPDTIKRLLDSCRLEAQRAPFPVDSEIYALCDREAHTPILAAGNLSAPLCVFGRDLGKDEVRHAQPLVGAAGKLVRRGLLSRAGLAATSDDTRLETALRLALFCNTVPFKPLGNKAYSNEVKERFRPFVARLLGECWQGERLLTLGTEAFLWFAPYLDPAVAKDFWNQEDRYEQEIECVLGWQSDGRAFERRLVLAPLPHPSPLNRRWLGAFPELLSKRLEG